MVVERLLATRPEDRFPTAGAVAEALAPLTQVGTARRGLRQLVRDFRHVEPRRRAAVAVDAAPAAPRASSDGDRHFPGVVPPASPGPANAGGAALPTRAAVAAAPANDGGAALPPPAAFAAAPANDGGAALPPRAAVAAAPANDGGAALPPRAAVAPAPANDGGAALPPKAAVATSAPGEPSGAAAAPTQASGASAGNAGGAALPGPAASPAPVRARWKRYAMAPGMWASADRAAAMRRARMTGGGPAEHAAERPGARPIDDEDPPVLPVRSGAWVAVALAALGLVGTTTFCLAWLLAG
jgi:hypothetical protein